MSQQGYQHLSAKDVVFVEGLSSSKSLFTESTTLRGSDLLTKVQQICVDSGEFSAAEIELLFGRGIKCEVLRPGATDWHSGQLQMKLGVEAATSSTAASAPIASSTASTPKRDTSTADTTSPVTPEIKAPVTSNATAPSAIELDLDNFANATAPSTIETSGEVDLSSDDIFSLMDDAEAEPLDSGFFNTSAEEIEAFSLEENAAPKNTQSLESPWDVDELDSMLMAK